MGKFYGLINESTKFSKHIHFQTWWSLAGTLIKYIKKIIDLLLVLIFESEKLKGMLFDYIRLVPNGLWADKPLK